MNQQSFQNIVSAFPAYPPHPITVHRIALPLPSALFTPPAPRLAHVTAQIQLGQMRQHGVGMIALIRHRFAQLLDRCLGFIRRRGPSRCPSSPWWKSRGSRCERRDDECETAGGRRCYSIGDERQRSRWRRVAATRWARGGYGRRLCHSSGPMARIATAPRFAPDTRKTLSRDPRDFHHGLLNTRPANSGNGRPA